MRSISALFAQTASQSAAWSPALAWTTCASGSRTTRCLHRIAHGAPYAVSCLYLADLSRHLRRVFTHVGPKASQKTRAYRERRGRIRGGVLRLTATRMNGAFRQSRATLARWAPA